MEEKGIIHVNELEAERASLSTQIDELKRQLDEAQQRHEDIGILLATWARIQGERPRVEAPDAPREKTESGVLSQPTAKGVGTKRIPSTRMVVELVQSQKKTWTREEIHRAFEETYGIPDSWTNPANALNNAISRGVESGKMEEDGEGYRAV